MDGQWKERAFYIHSAASAVRLAIFQPQNMSKSGLGKGTKIERQMWPMNTWNRCAIADQIEQFFIKRRRCASQAGNGFLKSPSIGLGVNGYAKIILRQRKRWVWGSMLQKRWFLLKRYLDPHECSTRSCTPRSNSWNWITNLGRFYLAAEPEESCQAICQITSLLLLPCCWMS